MAKLAPKVFISYSHKDEKWKDRVVTHLGVLEKQAKLELWDDRRIAAGDDWLPAIERTLESCDMALLLISAHFLTSDFILKKEVPRLLARRIAAGVLVLPVIVRDCAWQKVDWLSPIQARPRDGGALAAMTRAKADAALAALAKEVLSLASGDARPAPPNPPPEPLALTKAERDYLEALVEECDRLPLVEDRRKLKPGEDAILPASLSRVYVDLATTRAPTLEQVLDRLEVPEDSRVALARELAPLEGASSRHGLAEGEGEEAQLLAGLARADRDLVKKSPALAALGKKEAELRAACRPLSTLEALHADSHWVLVGGPGSGKSTFVHHLATDMAQALLGQKSTNPGRVETFPIRIVLHRWAKVLPKRKPSPTAALRAAFEGLETEVPWGRWLERLNDPRTLVLFDGLDEVPTSLKPAEDRRAWLVEAISAFAKRYRHCRVVMSCRVRPYREGRHQILGWPVFELAPLDTGRIERFCDQWHEEMVRIRKLTKARAGERREHLRQALRNPRREKLADMAKSPLLLTMLAKVNLTADLPEERVALYQECVHQLLWEWEKSKDEAGELESLDRLLDEAPERIGRDAVEKVLCELAFQVHGTVAEDTAELPADDLEKRLRKLGSDGRAMSDWAFRVVDLLKRRDGLLVKRDDETFTFPHRSFQEYLAALWLTQMSEVDAEAAELALREIWFEVVLLACGQLAKGALGTLFRVLAELGRGDNLRVPGDWRRPLLAGRAWVDLKVTTLSPPDKKAAERKAKLEKELPGILTRLLQHSKLPPAQRLEAGEILADLGVVPEDLGELVEIPAERLGYRFKIGKYPVTNSEFKKFVEAGGYERDRPWWSEQAKQDFENFGGGWPKEPRLWAEPRRNRASFPVVGVSWYEATAYCGWLETRLKAEKRLPKGYGVRLATQEQWQAAAAGPGSGVYPWGKKANPLRGNTAESELGGTSPVHMYPAQTKEPEVWDLVGNVWEWLADRDEGGWPYLAGGAYWKSISETTTAARDWLDPGSWNHLIGFRVVLVPSSRRSSES